MEYFDWYIDLAHFRNFDPCSFTEKQILESPIFKVKLKQLESELEFILIMKKVQFENKRFINISVKSINSVGCRATIKLLKQSNSNKNMFRYIPNLAFKELINVQIKSLIKSEVVCLLSVPFPLSQPFKDWQEYQNLVLRCHISIQGQRSCGSHSKLLGCLAKTKTDIVGLNYIYELKRGINKNAPWYVCNLCNTNTSYAEQMVHHLDSITHKAVFLQYYLPANTETNRKLSYNSPAFDKNFVVNQIFQMKLRENSEIHDKITTILSYQLWNQWNDGYLQIRKPNNHAMPFFKNASTNDFTYTYLPINTQMLDNPETSNKTKTFSSIDITQKSQEIINCPNSSSIDATILEDIETSDVQIGNDKNFDRSWFGIETLKLKYSNYGPNKKRTLIAQNKVSEKNANTDFNHGSNVANESCSSNAAKIRKIDHLSENLQLAENQYVKSYLHSFF